MLIEIYVDIYLNVINFQVVYIATSDIAPHQDSNANKNI